VTVTNATWSSGGGGVATLTLASVPELANEGEDHYLPGPFTLSGVTPSGYNGTFNVVSSSFNSTFTVTYCLASNPRHYSGRRTLAWPLVRQFNESVYTLDVADGGVPTNDAGATDAGAINDAGPSSAATDNSGCSCRTGAGSSSDFSWGLALVGFTAYRYRKQ